MNPSATHLILLSVFLVGGVAAPAVHHSLHGLEYAAASRAAAVFEGHVDADHPVLSYPLPPEFYDHQVCILCSVDKVRTSLIVACWLAPTRSIRDSAHPEPQLNDSYSETHRGRAPPLS